MTEAQNSQHILTFIRSDTTEAEWAHMKTDKVFETELGDIALVAAARAIHKDILVFNTNKHISISPIKIICADHYEGGYRNNENPILLAYNGIHFESLETMNTEDDKKAIELVKLKKTNGFILDKTHIEVMTRISQTKKTQH